MTGDCHVRICGGRRVRLPPPTRRVSPGGYIPTLLGRTPELVTILAGILRAGSAYVAIDPRWPQGRIDDAIAQCASPIVITDADELTRPPSGAVAAREPAPLLGTGPACVFFTSGSTGKPKGVIVPHRGLVRAVVNSPELRLNHDTVLLQSSPMPWDGFAFELWAPLLNGGCAVLREDRPGPVEATEIRRAIQNGANSVPGPSAMFGALAEDDQELFAGLQQLLVAGDRMPVHATRQIRLRYPELRLLNGYGPAENSIITTVHVIREEDVREFVTDIPIGRPIVHTRVEVIDESGAPVPPGTVGLADERRRGVPGVSGRSRGDAAPLL